MWSYFACISHLSEYWTTHAVASSSRPLSYRDEVTVSVRLWLPPYLPCRLLGPISRDSERATPNCSARYTVSEVISVHDNAECYERALDIDLRL